MKTFRVLVLTDHSGHSAENSMYALVREMNAHPRCQSIAVASRGMRINNAFFRYQDGNSLFAVAVGDDFHYSEIGLSFQKEVKNVKPEDFDIVFLRLPRPVSDKFLLWLEKIFKHCIIINRPSGIVETSNKAFLLELPGTASYMRLISSIEDIHHFARLHPIVLKPLRAYGGQGIIKVEKEQVDDGENTYTLKQYRSTIEKEIEAGGYLGMKFLKNVSKGDKRIIVVDGEIMAASLRLPAMDKWLCNVAQGGTAVPASVSEEEVDLIKSIVPIFREKGILIFGADTLEDDNGKRIISEVNTLSIGGFMQAQNQSGKPIIKKTIDKIFNYADQQNA